VLKCIGLLKKNNTFVIILRKLVFAVSLLVFFFFVSCFFSLIYIVFVGHKCVADSTGLNSFRASAHKLLLKSCPLSDGCGSDRLCLGNYRQSDWNFKYKWLKWMHNVPI